MRNEPSFDFAREQPDAIDALIDSAARQMVAGEPSASLRGTMRDRVAAGRPVWSLVPAWGVAAGAVLAALIVGRALTGPPGERDNVRPTIEREVSPQPQFVVEQVRDVQTPRMGRRLADDVAALPQEEEPLIPPISIEPLEPAQIVVGTIAVESSGVMPIEIAPLQLEPLRGIE